MDKIGNLATISSNLYDYNNWMDKIKNFVGNNANLDNSQDGIKPYKISSKDVKLDLKLNLNEVEKEKVIKAFGYQKNSDGTYGYAQKFDIINGDLSLLSYQERVKLTGLNEYRPLSGFTRYSADKVSIWGKITGLDPNFSKEEIKDLVDFIDLSGGIAIEQIEALQYNPNPKSRTLRTTPYTVEELALQNANSIISPWQIYELNGELPHTISLLDSDLSVEDFKAKWAKHVIKIQYGLDISDEDAKNAVNIFKELKAGEYKNDKSNLNEANKEDTKKPFTPIQGFSLNNKTYQDEAIERLKKLYEMIKSEFDNGKTELEILKQLAKLNLKV
ncbi:polyribonucleotide nucleotidyltransferase [Campylobacter hyointestinalis]|uniref:hypothetical protein n=1 Tax=Campylobacter hyointestinalis TaxID=198 RepID=UPI000690E10F|nr:hypothetical protein [Campylobacter hyointestinalis]QKF55290.1 hypothetical protein CHHT_0420 [Campylobacter hyointestinalis subsp. hyointestinalis]TXK46123.1 hypothetical protein A0Z69_07380 [Campylobacter hyointestinalis]SFT49165.1 hypothetical protein SAMN05421691_0820 [Campylobacter hyointestinalis]SUW90025.1 polyribonucleotide nucleotidyltransferase [Campylobacter hyointestinalis]